MSLRDEGDPRRKTAYITTSDRTRELLTKYEKYPLLLGNPDVRYDPDGFIYWQRWKDRQIPKDGIVPSSYQVISPTNSSADIYAAYSRYEDGAEPQIVKITKDDGSLETAIRACDHILFKNRAREYRQASSV